MAHKPPSQFGKRNPQVPAPPGRPQPPAKRSHRVALLLMGTVAVGGTAYMLMPHNNCPQTSPGVAAPSSAECQARSSSSSHGGSGGSSSRSSYYGSDSSSHSSSGTTSDSGTVKRGGFGSFAHAFSFSGGG